MVDTRVLGSCWIELPAGKWFKREKNSMFPITSRSQIEVDVAWDVFIAHAPEGEWAKVAPFRIHSFDIECAGRKGRYFNTSFMLGIHVKEVNQSRRKI